MFVWGEIGEDENAARRTELLALRDELDARPDAGTVSTITSIGHAWGLADVARRRQLLNVLFEKLYVRDGDVIKYVPRREYRHEVEALMALAVGDGLEYDRPLTGKGANLTREGRNGRAAQVSDYGGKGGVLLRVRQQLEVAAG